MFEHAQNFVTRDLKSPVQKVQQHTFSSHAIQNFQEVDDGMRMRKAGERGGGKQTAQNNSKGLLIMKLFDCVW